MRPILPAVLLLLPAVTHAEEPTEGATRKWGSVSSRAATVSDDARRQLLSSTAKAPLQEAITVRQLSIGRMKGQPEGAALAKARLNNPNAHPVAFEVRLSQAWGTLLAGEEIELLKDGEWKPHGRDLCGTGRSLHTLAAGEECEVTIHLPRREGVRIFVTFYNAEDFTVRSRTAVFSSCSPN